MKNSLGCAVLAGAFAMACTPAVAYDDCSAMKATEYVGCLERVNKTIAKDIEELKTKVGSISPPNLSGYVRAGEPLRIAIHDFASQRDLCISFNGDGIARLTVCTKSQPDASQQWKLNR